jgi:hypothetical protein
VSLEVVLQIAPRPNGGKKGGGASRASPDVAGSSNSLAGDSGVGGEEGGPQQVGTVCNDPAYGGAVDCQIGNRSKDPIPEPAPYLFAGVGFIGTCRKMPGFDGTLGRHPADGSFYDEPRWKSITACYQGGLFWFRAVLRMTFREGLWSLK